MTNEKTLNNLRIDESGVVKSVNCAGNKKRRFLDIGIVSGTKITALFKSPGKNPIAYLIRGCVIAIRNEDAKDIVMHNI